MNPLPFDAEGAPADPETWFHTLATHYVEAQIYFHLNQSGVFQKLTDAPQGAGDLAQALRLDVRILDILLDYCASVGALIARTAGGQYVVTPFGAGVLRRYGKVNGPRVTHNLFDVRIGAWGPLWTHLGGLLRQEKVYGVDVRRAGEYAADGLFKLAAPLASTVEAVAARLNAAAVVELGPTSGILAQLAEKASTRRHLGLDIKRESLADARRLAEERGVAGITWLLGDLFAPREWLRDLQSTGPVLFFSCHFHEFLAGGEQPVIQALREIMQWEHTAGIVALEQPRPQDSERTGACTADWLYAHSNVLIHHLIKNAKILTGPQWLQLLREAGCRTVTQEQTDCFGFNAYVGQREA